MPSFQRNYLDTVDIVDIRLLLCTQPTMRTKESQWPCEEQTTHTRVVCGCCVWVSHHLRHRPRGVRRGKYWLIISDIMRVCVRACLLLCLGTALAAATAGHRARSFSVDYARQTFVRSGAAHRYVSGTLHYFRVLRGAWRDRMEKMRLAGTQ